MPIHQLLRQRRGSAPRVGTINSTVLSPSGFSSSSSGGGIGGAANGGVWAHTPPVTAGAAGGWERERQSACHLLALDDALRSRASAGNAIADRTRGGLPGVCRGIAGVVCRSPPSGWHMQQEGTRSSVGYDPTSERSERALSAAKSGVLQWHQADASAMSAFPSTSSTSPAFTRIGRHREQTPRLPTSWASAPLSAVDRSCLSPASSASSSLLSNSFGFSHSAALGGREGELSQLNGLLAAHPDHWLQVLAGLPIASQTHSSTFSHLALFVRRPGSATGLQPPSFSASALAPWSAQAQWRGLSASSGAQQQHQQQAAQPGRAQGAGGKASGASAAPPQGSKVEDLAEECDEAVEDLGEVKARVLAAREAMRKGQGVLKASLLVVAAVFQRLWQMVAAVRHVTAVLRWSRQDWLDTFAGWWRVIKHGAHHYWVGTKLLWADVRISSRLLLKTAKGRSLTRRERQQLMRTSADIFRLVPFAVFVIVPFMEFLLPVALRLFPNMLPSTFQDKSEEEAKLKRLLKARLQMARFLQDTVGEMAKEVKGRRSGEIKKNAEELAKFMAKVRTGGRVSNEEILAFASLFNDELTLDNMTRPRLVSMCKYMGLQPFGTDAYLTYILRAKLAWIKEDDKLIQSEGVDSLSEQELRAACRERGMLGVLSVEEMRQQLRDWLDLSLNRSVPSSLLILSRSFLVAGKVRPEEAVQATLSSLPKKVLESVEASVPSGDETSERQRKLDLLKEQEKLIKEEAQEAERLRKAEEAARRDRALEEMRPAMGDISSTTTTAGPAAAAAAAAAAEAAQAARPFAEAEAAMGLSAMNGQDMAQQRARANRDQLCQLSAALAVLASSSAVSTERVDFLRLVNREIELYNRMVEETGKEGEEQARVAYEAAREASENAASDEQGVSEALINKVDTMLQRLEKELDAVDAKIGSKLRILDTDYDGKVTPEELAAAAALLRNTLGHGEVAELVGSLAKDKDGKILVEDIVRLGLLEPSETEDDDQPQQQLQQQQKQQKQVQETVK